MYIRKKLAALMLVAVLPLAACAADTTAARTTTTTSSSTSATTATAPDSGSQGGGPGGVNASSVSTESELVALVQEAYGEGGLDLHRGHQPVQDVLDEVLAISHDELHVRMEESQQNLEAVANDIGVDPQTLIAALVASWSPAIDAVLAAGEITEAQAEQYRAALQEAFEFRVTWNGEDATPSFSGLSA